ncbi:hypothetical protein TU94_16125 [Streptomyces cyaneogriseus subsp. noncyanogenus]|uniref:Uncharacterized protein n=1 Tax=Streptomyces cyaneogriseus subsp. noncyanogenus TaxID=477245 RepID=A0A0C5G3H2_9ACTN|nr:hypothetical protein [Streptomyces cyaneogriseus]AJP02774.1 hypothetical protein TU94_16125 [Streptomyces cyaneogriseus subsp. noncyanogenus]
MSRPRLLPWSEDGKPVYLDTDDPDSMLSRLADEMEEAQLSLGHEVLAAARQMVGDPDASRTELRFTAARLAECLFDALRVADSRGERLAGEGDDPPPAPGTTCPGGW